MPRKSIKIIHENTEEVDSIEKDDVPEPQVPEQHVDEPKPVKEKKPRTVKQIAAFAKALETRKAKAEAKKAEKALEENIPKEIPVPEVEMTTTKKKGRPALSPEKLEEKATMKELALQNQLNKLQQKLDRAAKREAKKEMLNKIKSKMNTEDDTEDIDTDDEIEIDKIVSKQKKPIVIVNKIDNGKVRKQPIVPQPTAIFV